MAEKFSVLDPTATIPGAILAASNANGGQIVLVARPRDGRLLLAFARDDVALTWTNCVDLGLGGSAGADLPLSAWTVDMAQLVTAIERERSAVDSQAKGGALRGEWKGALRVEGGTVKIGLVRAAAPYCEVRIESGESAWEVTVSRAARFFAAAQTQRRSFPKLAPACEWGMQAAAELVSAACGVRDTMRRGWIDPVYAEKHPVKVKQPAKRDPIAKDLKDLAKRVPTLASVKAPKSPSCPTSVAKIAKATADGAAALNSLADSLWSDTEAPELLTRAATLIREAEALAKSELCKGAKQKKALKDVQTAVKAYNRAREALLAGDGGDHVAGPLHTIATALAEAAKAAAEACGVARPPKAKAEKAEKPKAEKPKADKPKADKPEKPRALPKAKPKAKPSSDATAQKDAMLAQLFGGAFEAVAMKMHQQGLFEPGASV